MSILKWLAAALAVLMTAGLGLAVYGKARWARSTDSLLAELEQARQRPRITRFDARELESLPPPVQRYFRLALLNGQPIVAGASVSHAGSFNMGEQKDLWKSFSSQQRVITHRPGFVWDARVAVLPGIAVHVHDAYIAGTGLLHPGLLGLITLANLRGSGQDDMARGELMRFFAEAPWYPTALLPSQGVRWEAVDANSARATLVDGVLSLTLLFRFGQDGLIDSVYAESRGRTVGEAMVATPWEGRWFDYQERGGMRVPMRGEVAWLLPEGRKPYWRGTITGLKYEFVP